jgi:hypothetical protein
MRGSLKSTVPTLDRAGVVAAHVRAARNDVGVVDLDHNLEILLCKPGALPERRRSRRFAAPRPSVGADKE